MGLIRQQDKICVSAYPWEHRNSIGVMQIPDLLKLRTFSLVIAIILVTLVLAGVELETPMKISPLGLPLIIQRPDLISVALVIASIYVTLRYIYFGMLVQPSPMRARRELLAGRPVHTAKLGLEIESFAAQIEKEIARYFPRVGKIAVTYDVTQDAKGVRLSNLKVPRIVHVVCWIENFDFLLPVIANVVAVAFWALPYSS